MYGVLDDRRLYNVHAEYQEAGLKQHIAAVSLSENALENTHTKKSY